jgi:CubicO group peptidase (beta-lactamase class C family)
MRLTICLLFAAFTPWQSALPTATQQSIGAIVTRALETSGTPSASVAIVVDGQVAFTHAYGNAKVSPDVAATPAMRY